MTTCLGPAYETFLQQPARWLQTTTHTWGNLKWQKLIWKYSRSIYGWEIIQGPQWLMSLSPFILPHFAPPPAPTLFSCSSIFLTLSNVFLTFPDILYTLLHFFHPRLKSLSHCLLFSFFQVNVKRNYKMRGETFPKYCSLPTFSSPSPHPFPCLANLIPLLAHPSQFTLILHIGIFVQLFSG